MEVDKGLHDKQASACEHDGCFGWADASARLHLEPLLFLVYMNDISEDLSANCRLDYNFADNFNFQRDVLIIQIDLDLVVSWSRTWQLPLNASKCKVISISNQKSPFHFTYTINNTEVQWVENFV